MCVCVCAGGCMHVWGVCACLWCVYMCVERLRGGSGADHLGPRSYLAGPPERKPCLAAGGPPDVSCSIRVTERGRFPCHLFVFP